MKHIIQATFSLLLVWLPLSAQNLIIPHIVDGGGWQSTFVLTSTSANPASATLIFHQQTTDNGDTQPWNPTIQEIVSTSGMTLAGSSTLFLTTSGTAATTTQGWAELNADSGVVGYVVFNDRLPGHDDQEGTAPTVGSANRLMVPYDDSNGFVTGIAIVNPTGSPQDISVGFRTTTGLVATGTLPTLPAGGHTAFVLSQQFPVIQDHVGLAEFYSATGTLSMIALRFTPDHSFTSAPVYFQSGAPMITADPSNPYDTSNPYDPGTPAYMYRAKPGGGH
jgi:hypothetical protein